MIEEEVWGTGSRNARVAGATDRFVCWSEAEDLRDRYYTARRTTLIATGNFGFCVSS
jgi:hypothetical protein